jgi:hypothetical protein
MPYARTQNYTNSGDFLASEVNSDFDNLWLAGEQTNRSFSQSIRKPITDSDSISMELPEAASRTNSFLTFDSTGAVSTSPLAGANAPTTTTRQQFTGDGSTTVFTLAADPGSPAAVVIYIDGIYQEEGTYSISGSTLTFTEAPPTNASIEAVLYRVTDIGTTDANSVTYLPAGTGAVQTTVQTKLRESVSVKDFGAVGDGVTNDTAAIQAAINASSVVVFPEGTYLVTTVDISSKNLTLLGYGATIDTNIAPGAFEKTDHGTKVIIKGFKFTGQGSGIKGNQSQEVTAYQELIVEDCTFDMDSGIFGIYLVGTREPVITKCQFFDTNSGHGVYFKDVVSPFISHSVFRGASRTARGVHYPGTGTAYDAGLVITDTEIMGWDVGLECSGLDWITIKGCTIDYCNTSIKLINQDGGNISNNYIGSNADTAALHLRSETASYSPQYCSHIVISNNTFTGHYDGGNTYDNLLIDGTTNADQVVISSNNFTFYTRYGVNFNAANIRLLIDGNNFNERSGFGDAPIRNSLGSSDSGVTIKNNAFIPDTTISDMNVSSVCKRVEDNYGLSLDASGQGIITVGNSSVTVAHGISGFTPTALDVVLTPINSPAASASPFVSSVDATNLVISTVSAVSGSNAGINYRISRLRT